jgi:hypothetical protein
MVLPPPPSVAAQLKLEKIPEVARAYVHLDVDAEHNVDLEHKET